jgi:NRPS condensation-like uncharacterized protein
MREKLPAFPVSESSKDKTGTVFTHSIVGGMRMEEYFALEIYKGLLSNPAYLGKTTSALLRNYAVNEARLLIAELEEEITPPPTEYTGPRKIEDSHPPGEEHG